MRNRRRVKQQGIILKGIAADIDEIEEDLHDVPDLPLLLELVLF